MTDGHSNSFLEIIDLSFNFRSTTVLIDIDAHIDRKEIVCMLGPNSAGKSTLMLVVAGVLPVAQGKIIFNGHNINHLTCEEVVKQGIMLVPEGRLLFDGMTVNENLELGSYRRYDRKRRSDIKKDIEGVYSLFPALKKKSNQLAGMLSGGEQQMVAIGRSIMGRPELLLLDEPSLGLAPIIVQTVMSSLMELRLKHGITIFFSEQNAIAALEIADRGYILGSGKIVSEGTKEVFEGTDSIRNAYFSA